MKGLNYITNDKGDRIAVMLDLKKYGKIWEDFYDALIVEKRKNEPRISWKEAKKSLRSKK
ncbi:MAG: hypothetical protein ABIT08_17155 [Bacteroidia bacterium]